MNLRNVYVLFTALATFATTLTIPATAIAGQDVNKVTAPTKTPAIKTSSTYEVRIWWPQHTPRQQGEVYVKIQVINYPENYEASVPSGDYIATVAIYPVIKKENKKEKPAKPIFTFTLDKEGLTTDSNQPYWEGHYSGRNLGLLKGETVYRLVVTALEHKKDGKKGQQKPPKTLATKETSVVYVEP